MCIVGSQGDMLIPVELNSGLNTNLADPGVDRGPDVFIGRRNSVSRHHRRQPAVGKPAGPQQRTPRSPHPSVIQPMAEIV